MTDGDRPPFDVAGAWLYVGDMPVVHLVEEASEPATRDPKLEHFAFSATGLGSMLAELDERGIAYDTVRVPGLGLLQVNVFDPDGNHIHVDFAPEEADAAGLSYIKRLEDAAARNRGRGTLGGKRHGC